MPAAPSKNESDALDAAALADKAALQASTILQARDGKRSAIDGPFAETEGPSGRFILIGWKGPWSSRCVSSAKPTLATLARFCATSLISAFSVASRHSIAGRGRCRARRQGPRAGQRRAISEGLGHGR
jgi:hypothetical protein